MFYDIIADTVYGIADVCLPIRTDRCILLSVYIIAHFRLDFSHRNFERTYAHDVKLRYWYLWISAHASACTCMRERFADRASGPDAELHARTTDGDGAGATTRDVLQLVLAILCHTLHAVYLGVCSFTDFSGHSFLCRHMFAFFFSIYYHTC